MKVQLFPISVVDAQYPLSFSKAVIGEPTISWSQINDTDITNDNNNNNNHSTNNNGRDLQYKYFRGSYPVQFTEPYKCQFLAFGLPT